MTRLQASWFFIKHDLRCLVGMTLLDWAMRVLPPPYTIFVSVAIINISTASLAEREERLGS